MNSRGFLNFKGNPLLSSNMLRVTETLPGQHVQRICLLCLAVSISDLGIDLNTYKGFLGDSVVKNLPANAGDVSSIPELGRSPGEGNGNPLQYSCLGNPDRGDWWATVHGISKKPDTKTVQQQNLPGTQSVQFNPRSLVVLPHPSPPGLP